MARSAEEPSPSKDWQPKDHGGAWSDDVDDEAVVAEAALGGRDGAAERWARSWRGVSFVSPVHEFCLVDDDVTPELAE